MVPTMQVPRHHASLSSHHADPWLIVEERSSADRTSSVVAWAHDGGRADRSEELHRKWRESTERDARRSAQSSLIAEFPPTRWVTVPEGNSGIKVNDDRGADVVMRLPATLRAHVEVTERTSVTGKSTWQRTSPHEVTIEIERDLGDHGDARASVAAVTIRRMGDTPVTAGVVRAVLVGELVDWTLSRAPVIDGRPLGERHPATAEAQRPLRRRTGKRGRSYDLVRVAEVAQSAADDDEPVPAAVARELSIGLRTAKRALREARLAGLVPHSNRSRPHSA